MMANERNSRIENPYGFENPYAPPSQEEMRQWQQGDTSEPEKGLINPRPARPTPRAN